MKRILSAILLVVFSFALSTQVFAAQNIKDLTMSDITSQSYTGKDIKPSITIKDGDKTLEKGIDYTLSYSNNKNIGAASVKITGKGNYTGTTIKSFNIVPAKIEITKAVATTNSQVTLTWKKQSGITGYQVYYANSKNGEYKKLKTISNPSTITYTTKNLEPQKTYYFKVRAYKKADDKTYNGKYSAIKKVTTAKKAVDISKATIGEQNALKSAKQYLKFMPFSYKRLIEQLEYEKYSNKEAVFGADNCGADWNEQAVKSAKQYLDFMSFSRERLIEQLEYEGFTHEQAVYGVEKNGY